MIKHGTENKTILDHINNIVIPRNVFESPVNEYCALLCLKTGLFFINNYVLNIEKIVIDRLKSKNITRVFSWGPWPEFEGISFDILTCFFHWYAVSACQYVRTIGTIAYLQDNTCSLPPEYVRSVIPEVLTFRDKVAAHFAWSTIHSQDNEAERIASIIPPVSFNDDAFFVGTWIMSLRKNGKSTNSSTIKPWSITKVHRQLCERYWPEVLNM